jgi:hypothetical protein
VIEVSRPGGLPYELSAESKSSIKHRAQASEFADWMASARAGAEQAASEPGVSFDSSSGQAFMQPPIPPMDTVGLLDAAESTEGMMEGVMERMRRERALRERITSRQDEIDAASKSHGWSDETRSAVQEAHLSVSDMLGGADVELLSTSAGHENGRPDHSYWREVLADGTSVVHEYTERGPGGEPEVVSTVEGG